jgi:tripartite-type tricarboxylate transporter receptor subunit TctC
MFKTPEVVRRLTELGLDPVAGTPEELAAYQRAEITK